MIQTKKVINPVSKNATQDLALRRWLNPPTGQLIQEAVRHYYTIANPPTKV